MSRHYVIVQATEVFNIVDPREHIHFIRFLFLFLLLGDQL